MTRSGLTCIALLGLFLAAQLPAAPAAPAPAEKPSKAQRSPHGGQLARECEALIGAALKTPAGWGWGESADAAAAAPTAAVMRRPGRKPPNAPTRGEIDVRRTAAAGLLLHLAGEQLGEAKFTKAAADAARALTAVQYASGGLPPAGTLGAAAPRPAPRDKPPPAVAPERSATCAAIGLWLTVIQASEKPDEPMTRAAALAANLLAAQQTKRGGWIADGEDADNAAIDPAGRLVRLDEPDYRDATAALLLAAHVLGDAKLARQSGLAVNELVALRLGERFGAGRRLWTSAYQTTGEPAADVEQVPFAVDVLASRRAMQALLCDALLAASAGTTGEEEGETPAAAAAAAATTPSTKTLFESAKALAALPRTKGAWRRWYDFDPSRPAPRPKVEPAQPPAGSGDSDLFDPAEFGGSRAAPGDGPPPDAVPGVAEILNAVESLRTAGPAEYLERLDAGLWVQHRIALLLCGLGEDDVLTVELPTTRGGAEAFVKRQRSYQWELTEGPTPADLATRLERLRLLLLRAVIEQGG